MHGGDQRHPVQPAGLAPDPHRRQEGRDSGHRPPDEGRVRRCSCCGQFASGVILMTVYGPLAWNHRHCARRYGLVV